MQLQYPRISSLIHPVSNETLPEPEGETATLERPVRIEDETGKTSGEYRVILYDDDHTPVDAVIEQLIKATKCSLLKATKITREVEAKGRGICFRGARDKCRQVALVLREIRLQCEVDCD